MTVLASAWKHNGKTIMNLAFYRFQLKIEGLVKSSRKETKELGQSHRLHPHVFV